MSEREKTLIKVSLALLALVVVFLLMRRNTGASAGASYDIGGSSVTGANTVNNFEMEPANENAFQNYFNSQNDVSVNTFGLNEMSKQYIPMFGLVGMTSVGNIVVEQHITQEAPVGRMQAAPQQVYTAAKEPYQGYFGQHPSLASQNTIGKMLGAKKLAQQNARNGGIY